MAIITPALTAMKIRQNLKPLLCTLLQALVFVAVVTFSIALLTDLWTPTPPAPGCRRVPIIQPAKPLHQHMFASKERFIRAEPMTPIELFEAILVEIISIVLALVQPMLSFIINVCHGNFFAGARTVHYSHITICDATSNMGAGSAIP